MSELEARIASLSPEKRRLLERRLARAGLDRRSREGGGRTIPRRAEGPGPWPLTHGQRRLWFIDRMNPGTPAYNIPFAGRLAGPLDAGLLERSLREVVRRHAVLRSRFVLQDGEPAQAVDPEPGVRLPVVDLSRLARGRRDAEARRLTDAEPQAPFDLARGPVARMTLLRLGADGGRPLHDLLVTMPHIVTDAWSMAVLFRELPALYDAFRRGRPSSLPDPPVQVADYALWERERLAPGEEGGELARGLAFWREHLRGAPRALELPTDRPRPPVQTLRGVRHPVRVPPETGRALEELAEREGATAFMALLASFAALLGRWSGQDDVLAASPLATRGEAETQGLIGFFIDHAVLRTDLSGDPSFRELLARVRESALATFAHQGVPFERIAEAVGAGGDLSRPPLAQVNFVLQNVHIPSPEFEELTLLHAQQTDTRSARFDLSLGLFEADPGLEGWLEYNTDLFDATTMDRFAREWLRLVEAAAARPDARLSRLSALAPAARQQILVEWNDTARGGAAPEVHERVAGWAERTPDAAALAFEGPDGRPGALTYGELHRRVEALAGRLKEAGAGPEQGVAVSLPRSPELVAALLAVLRTGAFYVPVDPGLPAARRAALLAAVDPVACLGAEGPVVEEGRGTGGRGAGSVDRSDVPPEALAYVLFTSGSTGEPKGVTVTRGGLASYLAWAADAYPAGRGRGTPVHTAIGFDLTVTSLFVPLARGETVRLLPEEDGVTALAEVLRDGGLDLVKVTPAHLSALAELLDPAALPRAAGALVVGGEALFGERLAPWREGDGDLGVFNEYGPTETVVGCVVHEVPHGERPVPGPVPIGRPIRGARVYAVDADLRPTPLAVPGELLVGGPGVARGYLGLPGATAERFVPDPLSGRPGARLYRTGDRVRWRPGGALEFLGRIDRQVKVRGHRLELGEVEAVLAAHSAVREAVAELRDGRLVAWVAPRPDAPAEEVEPRSFRRFLEGRLPEHAIPAVFVPVASIPLTAHGKVDRRALPDPEAARAAVAGEAAPASAVEETLAAVWREVLGLDRVGVHDRFFELGGDSILALRAASRAAELGLRLEPRDLFEHPTIASLAAVVEGAPTGAAALPAPVEGPVPLGPAQRWFLEELAPPVPDHWNLALLLEPRGALPMDGVARAVRRLLARHDMLRARFRRSRREAGRWRQVVVPPDAPSGVAAPAAAVDLSGLPRERASGALEDALAACQGSLDLARGPLLRLVRLDLPTATRLLLVAHHLVTDAVSLRVLLGDLARGQSAPPAPTAPYRDWVEALEAWAGSPEGAAEAAVWRERGRLPAGAVGAGRGGEGPWLERDAERLEAGLPAAPGRELLGRASDRLRARPDEVLLAGVAAALAAEGGSREGRGRAVRLAVEGHGRGLPGEGAFDLSRTVGWFTVVYPVRIDLPSGDDRGTAGTAARTLRAVKAALRAVPSGGVGYASLRWGAGRALGDPTVPEVSFNYLGRLDEALGEEAPFRLSPAAPGPLRHPDAPRAHPLEVTAYVLDGDLRTVWSYDRRRYRRAEVAALADAALAVVRELTDGEDAAPGEAGALDPSDFPHAGLDDRSLERLVGKLGGR